MHTRSEGEQDSGPVKRTKMQVRFSSVHNDFKSNVSGQSVKHIQYVFRFQVYRNLLVTVAIQGQAK